MTSSSRLTAVAAALLLLVILTIILASSSSSSSVVVSAFSSSCGGKSSSSYRRQLVVSGRPSTATSLARDIATRSIINDSSRQQIPSSYDIITCLKSSASSETEKTTTTSPTTSSTITQSTDAMKELGTKLILSAAAYHGATSKMITIDWKFDKIIVIVDISADDDYIIGDTVDVSCAVGDLIDDEFDDDELLEYELVDDYDDIDYDDNEEFNEGEEDFETLQQQLGLQEQQPQDGKNQEDQKRTIDLTLIARTINEYLSQDGEDSLAFQIAKLHEIEVTTPEFDNVLRDYSSSNTEEEGGGGGVNMFEVYKGFDVIVDYWEVPKQKMKKKSGKAGKDVAVAEEESATTEENEEEEEEGQKTKKVIEGKLVGRDNDKGVTMVNVKGRITKIKNDMIDSVKLPKAKREKGVK